MVFCSYLLWLMVMSECDTPRLMLQICSLQCTMWSLSVSGPVPFGRDNFLACVLVCATVVCGITCGKSSIIGSRGQNENRQCIAYMYDVSIAYFHLLRIHRVLADWLAAADELL